VRETHTHLHPQYPEGSAARKETDPPNFTGSFYSKTKGMVEKLVSVYPNSLTLRLRMPLSDDLHHRSLLTKLAKYPKIMGNVLNSVSVLSDLLPVSVSMATRGCTGVYNFTNPGAVCHSTILDLYKQHIDPSYSFESFQPDDPLFCTLMATRSNCELDSSKLLKEFPEVPHVDVALPLLFQRIKGNLAKQKE